MQEISLLSNVDAIKAEKARRKAAKQRQEAEADDVGVVDGEPWSLTPPQGS